MSRKIPSAVVRALRISPVARFRKDAVAPPTARPFTSRTTPSTAPVFRGAFPGSCGCCAAAMVAILVAAETGNKASKKSGTNLARALDAASILDILEIVGNPGKIIVRD